MKISFNKILCFSVEGQMKVNVKVGAKHVIHILLINGLNWKNFCGLLRGRPKIDERLETAEHYYFG